MPWPTPAYYGVVDNPLIDSPFLSSSEIKGSAPPPPSNRFLLSDGSSFLLSDGTNFLLST